MSKKYLLDEAGKTVGVQTPLSTNGDSVYAKDIWVSESVTTNWADLDSSGAEIAHIPFSNLHTRIQNTTSDNPKTLLIHFNRTIETATASLSCAVGGSFSNIKLYAIKADDSEVVVYDGSLTSTVITTLDIKFDEQEMAGVKLEFHTANTITLSSITVFKSIEVNATLRAKSILTNAVEAITSARGSLNTNPTSQFKLEIALGHIPGLSFAVLSGVNETVTATETTVNPPGFVYPFLLAEGPLTVKSTSGNDIVGGTGANYVFINGLDFSRNPITETVAMNGTVGTVTTKNFFRVQPFPQVVLPIGSGKKNAGIISITSGTSILGQIAAGENIGKQTVYTVPLGFSAISTNQLFTGGGGNEVLFTDWVDFGGVGIMYDFGGFFVANSLVNFVPENFFIIPEKSDIDIRAKRSVGTTATATVFYEILLVDNALL